MNWLKKTATEIRTKYNVDIKSFATDLSVSGNVNKVYDKAKQEQLLITVLVNNAGFGNYGLFWDGDLTTILNMIALNITALTQLSKLFVEDMLIQGQGKILNIASIAGFVPTPYMAVYAATKAYVISFGQALACELKSKGITVTTYCPPDVATGFQKTAGLAGAHIQFDGNAQDVAQAAFADLENQTRVGIPDRFSYIKNYLPSDTMMEERLLMLSPGKLFIKEF